MSGTRCGIADVTMNLNKDQVANLLYPLLVRRQHRIDASDAYKGPVERAT